MSMYCVVLHDSYNGLCILSIYKWHEFIGPYNIVLFLFSSFLNRYINIILVFADVRIYFWFNCKLFKVHIKYGLSALIHTEHCSYGLSCKYYSILLLFNILMETFIRVLYGMCVTINTLQFTFCYKFVIANKLFCMCTTYDQEFHDFPQEIIKILS